MQIYRKCGVTSGLVSLGGNVQLLGAKPDGSAWKVAVESPEEDGNYLGILQAKDKAVITSGGYERYFEKNGKKYHHIIDPSTGYPAENGLTSVTIISDDGTLADGLSTSLFISDADRLGVIDDEGKFVHPNKLLVLLYYYLVKYRGWSGPCVRNNSTTHLLDRVAEGLGQKCYEVPVGFKWVSAKMTETDAIIGGESSGGLAVKGHISGKDGIYAASLLVEMLAVTGKKLSELYREICDGIIQSRSPEKI